MLAQENKKNGGKDLRNVQVNFSYCLDTTFSYIYEWWQRQQKHSGSGPALLMTTRKTTGTIFWNLFVLLHGHWPKALNHGFGASPRSFFATSSSPVMSSWSGFCRPTSDRTLAWNGLVMFQFYNLSCISKLTIYKIHKIQFSNAFCAFVPKSFVAYAASLSYKSVRRWT